MSKSTSAVLFSVANRRAPVVRRWARGLAALGLVLGLAACSTVRVAAPAPVEDRNPMPSQTPRVSEAPVVTPLGAPAVPGSENAGKPGYYTVRPGDSLIRIGLDTGQNWRDLARWNGLDNPNKLEVGQVLRVIAPKPGAPVAVPASPAVAAAPVPSAAPVPQGAGVGAAPVTAAAPVVAQPLPAATPAPAAAAPAAKAPVEDGVAFIWPAEGAVLAGFDDVKNKGVDISGKAGQPVLAAADGRVVYAGAAVRGFGNLIILKHSNTLLSAYAHNQALLVKEDQTVKQGQKIAEMGSSDTDRVKLHFEIRRQGKPVDPVKLLPAR